MRCYPNVLKVLFNYSKNITVYNGEIWTIIGQNALLPL